MTLNPADVWVVWPNVGKGVEVHAALETWAVAAHARHIC